MGAYENRHAIRHVFSPPLMQLRSSICVREFRALVTIYRHVETDASE
jgi:hypothetical protein